MHTLSPAVQDAIVLAILASGLGIARFFTWLQTSNPRLRLGKKTVQVFKEAYQPQDKWDD
jgi:hypothetical protein